MKYLILAEKPSAMKNFAKALGGMSGNFNGKVYKLTASHGHLMQWQEPEKLVEPSLAETYKSWSLDSALWNFNDMKWRKTYSIGINPKTKRKSSTKTDIDRIKSEASDVDVIVIATDVDPSGEGEMIGWEIIDAIGWKKPVYRMYHADESEKEVQKAFKNIKDISDKRKDGEYNKALARSMWDYMSMQLTRYATSAARTKDINVVANQGRLKSVIVKKVFDQEQAIKNYVRKPYYEARFQDDNGNIFKIDNEEDSQKFENKQAAEREVASLSESQIGNVNKVKKTTMPPKLLDLSGLSSLLAPKGFNPKEVLNTYQKMYEDQIVSYPRTEDKFVSEEQFNEMLPMIEKIANVVGVDPQLLSHRTPRKTHIKSGGAHGANRPGLNVPLNLDALSKYGKSAKEIYEILSRNFLAMFAEDYVYEQTTAELVNDSRYKTKINIPLEMNFKQVFNVDDDNGEKISKGLGTIAKPFVYEGANKKPQKPTMKWIDSYLSKYNVGTGATRTSTLAELTTRLLNESKGTLTTTESGKVSAVLVDGAWISDVKVTETLFNAMEEVGRFKRQPKDVLQTVTQLVKHDREVMVQNIDKLDELNLDKLKSNFVQKDKSEITFNGRQVKINVEWGGHKFTDHELSELEQGNEITFKTNKGYSVSGKLAEQTFKGRKFVGFKKN